MHIYTLQEILKYKTVKRNRNQPKFVRFVRNTGFLIDSQGMHICASCSIGHNCLFLEENYISASSKLLLCCGHVLDVSFKRYHHANVDRVEQKFEDKNVLKNIFVILLCETSSTPAGIRSATNRRNKIARKPKRHFPTTIAIETFALATSTTTTTTKLSALIASNDRSISKCERR
jgi:hypothetical protein